MDTERGRNSREDKAVVSRKRHVMDNGLMFIFFSSPFSHAFSPGCLENLMKGLEQIVNTSDEIMT